MPATRYSLVLLIIFLCCSLAFTATISVTELPGGEREVSAAADFGAQVLRISANGELLSWTDCDGNAQLVSPGNSWDGKRCALTVLEGNTQLFPEAKATVSIKAVSAQETRVTVTGAGEQRLVYIVEPERLGIMVEGPAAQYTVQFRTPCRGEGSRVEAPAGTAFATAGLGKLVGSPQLLVDARRSQALLLEMPQGREVVWGLTQLDGWSWVGEHLAWQLALQPGEVVWLSAVPVPRLEEAVKVGLYRRRSFRPEGGPAAIATLSAGRLTPNKSITVTLDKSIESVVKDGTLCAALIPVSPDDPVEASEQGRWYGRFDHYSQRMLPVKLERAIGGWRLAPTPETPPNVYRLRLWLAPKTTRLPEVLGGAFGEFRGYFPGFDARASAISQSSPLGDALVSVGKPLTRSLCVLNPAVRESFWRGEQVALLLQARGATDHIVAQVNVHPAQNERTLASSRVVIPLKNGLGATEFSLATTNLAPGAYTVSVFAPDVQCYAYTFTIAPPLAGGMPVINSPLTTPHDLEAYTRLGVNLWVDVMPSTAGYAPTWPSAANTSGLFATEPFLPLSGTPTAGVYDELVRGNWLFLQGIQSRQISFGLHHTIPEQVDETLRKHLAYAQFGRRFPSTLGEIFDYDLSGALGFYGYDEAYNKSWARRLELLKQRWNVAWETAQKLGATDADKGRIQSLFYADVVADIYRRSTANLHAQLPEQRHSSAVTADHNYMSAGQYLPAIYRPLDFRYLEVWNDQVYPNSAHDMQESFWTSLLRMEKPLGQPLWVTIPTAAQPGTHLRRALEAISRGATGIGYNGEGAAGLTGGWGADPTLSNVRTVQEAQSGEMAKRYGGWLSQFEPDEQVGILYSVSQGGTNWGLSSPIFFAYYTLAQLNRPARLLTEDEIANGALKSVKALLVVQQSAKLPDATQKGIAAFIAAGGKVLCDRDTKLPIPGAVKLDTVGWPGSLWPNGGNKYHNLLQSFVASMGGTLQAALGDAGRQPLECADAQALIASKRAPGATLVVVTNNDCYPFEQLFSDEQRMASFWRIFSTRGGAFYKDVRVPRQVTLTLRDDLANTPPIIYDVFAGNTLPLTRVNGKQTIQVDLATMPGRVLLLTDKPLSEPVIAAGAKQNGDPLLTLVVKSGIPLPVRIRVASQEIFRAATVKGSCDTFALGAAGDAEVEVRNLITGRVQRAIVKLSAPAKAILASIPAVQVCDAARIRAVLQAKDLAVYVDARQADQVTVATNLLKRLGHGELEVNPPVRDYPLAWSLASETETAKEQLLREKQLGWRQPGGYLQWTGALAPAAVWNRPVLLFGNALNNRLIADLNAVTMLARPALPDNIGHGRAFVQPVAAPFWNGQPAVVILCADADGLRAACEQVAAIAAGKSMASYALSDDGGARAECQRVLGFSAPTYPAKLTALRTTSTHATESLAPMLPVCALSLVRDGLIATLASPGCNLVCLGADGTPRWRAVSGGFSQPERTLVNEAGESVVSDGTFVWRHAADGSVRWKMLASPLAAPLADGSVWVQVENTLRQVAANGAVLASVVVNGAIVGNSPDMKTIYLQRPGEGDHLRAGSSLAAINLADGKDRWSVSNLQAAETRVSDDGTVIACIEHENMAGRDDIESLDYSRLTAIEAASGRVLLREPLGQAMSELLLSPNGKYVIAAGRGFSDVLFIGDTTTGSLRRVQLPERGGWARALTTDNRELWIACERLYRLNLATLAVTPALLRRLVRLAPHIGGMYAGTAEGAVLWLDQAGNIEREVNLASGIAVEDMAAALAPLRIAPTVDSPSLQPHDVPCTIPLVPEYPGAWGDTVSIRGDGINPIEVAVRLPAPGRYRFTVTLTTPKEQADKMGLMSISPDGKTWVNTTLTDDKWQQSAEMTLEAKTYVFTIKPVPGWVANGWKIDALVRTLQVERVDGK